MAEGWENTMAYDKNILNVLQLLCLDLGNVDHIVLSNTTIARYVIDGDYFPRYCIADVVDSANTMDIRGATEETMHAILDYGGTAGGLCTAMGLVPEAEIDPDIVESGEYVPIDPDYYLDGQLISLEMLPLDECDFKDAPGERQTESVVTTLNDLSVNLRLPVAKVFSQRGFTERQTYQVYKALEVGVDADVISERIANPVLNHARIREPRCIAVYTDFVDHDASPYKKDAFKTLPNGEYTAEHLHQTRELTRTTAIHDIAFSRDWLKLDSRQTEVTRHALKSDVPTDALEKYADGTYTVDHVNAIIMALTEGTEKPGIEHLVNPDLSMGQVRDFYSAISDGRFTSEQPGALCDPIRPMAVTEVMRTGLTFGVGAQTVLRPADGSFVSEQMESLYLVVGGKDIMPEMLDVIADVSLKPEQMDTLKTSLQQGGPITDVEVEKKSTSRSAKYVGQVGKADAICSTKLHETAKESREASAQLGSESHDDKAVEHEGLE